MEGLDIMDWMLAEAKKKPMKISHDFDTRFRVWVDQIIPARVNAIRQCKGNVDYAMRMVELTVKDAQRLQYRSYYEHSDHGAITAEYGVRIEETLVALSAATIAYLNEVKQ